VKENPIMKKILVSLVAVLAVTLSSSVQVAHAQFAVIDPANLVENIISALQDLASVANQAVQLEHEVESLSHEVQNLQSLPGGVTSGALSQYVSQYASLVATLQGIDGIAHSLSSLTAQYDATFPNTALATGPLSYGNVMSQMTNWLSQSRSVYQGAYQTQAQVMSALGADAGNVEQLLTQSGASSGALDAIEAGNAITAQVASQLMKLNAQMAATNQAQMNWIGQQTQMVAQAQQIAGDSLAGYASPGARLVNASVDTLH
jgi:P-type conjugative transfer protein TrbJ